MANLRQIEIKNFTTWLFRKATKDISFYGVLLVLLSAVMTFTGCPMPWPKYTFYLGFSLVIIELVYVSFMLSYSIYRMEQDRLLNELKKDNSRG